MRLSLENVLPVVQGFNIPEDSIDVVVIGQDDVDTGGVEEHGAFAVGGPVTWETRISPREQSRMRRPGDRSPTRPRYRMHVELGEEQASGDEVGRWRGTTEVAIDGDQGVGGLHTSDDAGERTMALGPGRAKAVRAETNFRRETCPMHRRRITCHRNY